MFIPTKGPLTCPTAVHSHAFFCSSVAPCNKKQDWPDIQIYMGAVGPYENMAKDFSAGFGWELSKAETYLKPDIGKDGFFLMPTLLLPKSNFFNTN